VCWLRPFLRVVAQHQRMVFHPKCVHQENGGYRIGDGYLIIRFSSTIIMQMTDVNLIQVGTVDEGLERLLYLDQSTPSEL